MARFQGKLKKGAGAVNARPRLKQNTPTEAKENAQMTDNTSAGTSAKGDDKEAELKDPEYWVVTFGLPANKEERRDHFFCVGSDQKLVRRGKATILHNKFIEVARNAVEEQLMPYVMADGTYQNRIEKVHTCPFTVLAPATREQYQKLYQLSNRVARDNAEKYGKDAPPDEVLKDQEAQYFEPIIQEAIRNARLGGFKQIDYGVVMSPFRM